MNDELRKLVWARAHATCEYCRVPQSLDPLPFGIDHVRPEYHHGPTVAENLCLACFNCNTFKAVNIAGFDPDTDELCRLFHPRHDTWTDHFEFANGLIIGRSAVGRTTTDVLRLNLSDRLEHRRLLAKLGAFGERQS